MANTIQSINVKGDGMRKHGIANAAITPGHLIERMSTGKLRVHATAGGKWGKLVALEQKSTGKESSVAYAANDYVHAEFVSPGEEFNLLVANGAAAIVVGDFVESAGDGTVRKVIPPLTTSVGTGDGVIADVTSSFVQATLNNNFKDIADAINGGGRAVGVALEALDNSGGSVPLHLLVEML